LNTKTLSVEEAVDDPRQALALNTDANETVAQNKPKLTKGNIFQLKYDKLVVAVGSYNQTFNTPGIKEHAYFLKDVGDARRIRNRLLSCKCIHYFPRWY
jgi:NADH dehydrogenase FAD-containing subunit